MNSFRENSIIYGFFVIYIKLSFKRAQISFTFAVNSFIHEK